MDKNEWVEYRELQTAGWELQRHNQVRLNGGSESIDHAVAKMLVAHAGHDAGYRVASEVPHERRGEIDVLLYGHDSRLTLAVECGTSPDDSVVQDKTRRYVTDTPIDDIAVINISTLPRDRIDAYQEVREVLGL